MIVDVFRPDILRTINYESLRKRGIERIRLTRVFRRRNRRDGVSLTQQNICPRTSHVGVMMRSANQDAPLNILTNHWGQGISPTWRAVTTYLPPAGNDFLSALKSA